MSAANYPSLVWLGVNKIYSLLTFYCFRFKDENEKLPYTNIVVKWDDIEVIENNPRKELLDSNKHYSHSGKNNVEFPPNSNPNSTISGFIRVLVHHVSMPFHIDKPPTYCLVYVSYINRKY